MSRGRPAPVLAAIEEEGIAAASNRLGVAAVLFSYRCTIACRHCCFGCGTRRPNVVMAPARCVEVLHMLHETGRVIHIAGGEAMLYWDQLAESVRLADAEDVAPHFIETNCSFAVSDELVRERFTFLKAHGLRAIYASCDPFHQHFVPADNFLRVRRLTLEIFGERMFYGSMADEAQIRELERIGRDDELLAAYARGRHLGMVGTAAEELAADRESFPPDSPELPAFAWKGEAHPVHCLDQFRGETIWELHIDPYGNIQTNCGIVLGHIDEVTPAELLARGPEQANRFVEEVCARGPLGLARLAEREYGFVMPERVVQGCHLCYLTRKHLRQFEPGIFGPAEIYG